MKKDITALFCWIDDFCKAITEEKKLLENKTGKPMRITGLADSEIMTIILMFQQSPCRNFKYFYQSYLQLYRSEFPKMPTYEKFVVLKSSVLYLLMILFCCILRRGSKVAYIDSTSLNACHPIRQSFQGARKNQKDN